MVQLDAALAREPRHGQVMRRAHARGGVVDRPRGGAGALDQALGVGRFRVEPHGQDQREAGHQAHGAEVLGGVVGQLLEQGWIEDQRAVVGGEHGVAVGLRLGGGRCPDVGGPAGLVLDHQLLAEVGRHPLRENPGQRVRAAAGGVRDDPGERAVGIGGMRAAGAEGLRRRSRPPEPCGARGEFGSWRISSDGSGHTASG